MCSSDLRIAGDWLAVGLDARPERLAEYPWRRPVAPTLRAIVEELAAAGVRRFILGHGGSAPDVATLRELTTAVDADLVVAGGITAVEALPALRDAGVSAVLLGEVLFTGAIDLAAAIRAAA